MIIVRAAFARDCTTAKQVSWTCLACWEGALVGRRGGLVGRGHLFLCGGGGHLLGGGSCGLGGGTCVCGGGFLVKGALFLRAHLLGKGTAVRAAVCDWNWNCQLVVTSNAVVCCCVAVAAAGGQDCVPAGTACRGTQGHSLR
jgi:hypothetical protein